MSKRRGGRGTGRSYTARLERRQAYRPPRIWPAWLTGPRLPALLALAAEAGHLAATLVEWPAAAPRGVFHVLVAGLLGAVAVTIYFGASRVGTGLGVAVTLLIPVWWLIGTIGGVSPYRDYPRLAAVAQTAAELAVAALLARRLASGRQQLQAPYGFHKSRLGVP